MPHLRSSLSSTRGDRSPRCGSSGRRVDSAARGPAAAPRAAAGVHALCVMRGGNVQVYSANVGVRVRGGITSTKRGPRLMYRAGSSSGPFHAEGMRCQCTSSETGQAGHHWGANRAIAEIQPTRSPPSRYLGPCRMYIRIWNTQTGFLQDPLLLFLGLAPADPDLSESSLVLFRSSLVRARRGGTEAEERSPSAVRGGYRDDASITSAHAAELLQPPTNSMPVELHCARDGRGVAYLGFSLNLFTSALTRLPLALIGPLSPVDCRTRWSPGLGSRNRRELGVLGG
ncbi:hypothetical protein C8R46DRAFT_614162 [Mycena filopes]|nr:hypothetical protein C8R46DRAFT_614162 [Mycena filopes]